MKIETAQLNPIVQYPQAKVTVSFPEYERAESPASAEASISPINEYSPRNATVKASIENVDKNTQFTAGDFSNFSVAF